MKETIILDFDGVIHSYVRPWQGREIIPDAPTVGAKEGIAKLRETYNVVVVSSRCSTLTGIQAVKNWLDTWKIVVDAVQSEKPPHIVVVDDRAIRFRGDWNEVIMGIPAASIPWNKKDQYP